MELTTRHIETKRWAITSTKPFDRVMADLDAALGHPDMRDFSAAMAAAKTADELAPVVEKAAGKSGFMEFARFDLGAVLRKESGEAAKSVRLLVGNPLVMKEMVKRVPDAGSYAPVSLLIDERAGAVRLSYDSVAALLAPFGDDEALAVAQDLDSKIERLLAEAAS